MLVCPKCGFTGHFTTKDGSKFIESVEIKIPGHEANYCPLCIAKWLDANIPKMEEAVK